MASTYQAIPSLTVTDLQQGTHFARVGTDALIRAERTGETLSISLPEKPGVEVGLPSGDPPACSTVTA